MSPLGSGELATKAGVNVETLRVYERKGILPQPPRRAPGYREYPPDAVERIRFIKQAQELSFTLKEIKVLLEWGADPQTTCADLRDRVELKKFDIEQKIRDSDC